MPKIARRYRVVTLPQGDQESELAALRQEILAAQVAEDAAGGRFGAKSTANAKAVEFDKLSAKAEKDAIRVTVHALAYDEFGPLQDDHPPRDDDAIDKRVGYNRKTFPHALLKASLVEPDAAADYDDLLVKGDEAFAELGRPTQVQYARLEAAAWDVNVGDDSLPKFSAVSLLKEAKERGSKQQPDSE
jgi:hypothetical protein